VIPEDREYFQQVTDGGIVVVGRKTFESIGKPLPNRKNIVLTNKRGYSAKGVTVAHSMSEALDKIPANNRHKVFVIGGAEVYAQFLPWCSYVYVTKYGIKAKSDRFFLNLDKSQDWELMHAGDLNEHEGILYSFDLYKAVSEEEN
jgi:dihydrofolate reductase